MSKNLKSFLSKKYPDSMDTDIITEIKYLDTEIPTLNYVISGKPLTGGLPMTGKISIMYGPEGCLASDSRVSYEVRSKKDGTILYCNTNSPIENLYYKFYNAKKGKHYRLEDLIDDNLIFYIRSIDTNDNVILNEIHDIVKTGQKECFRVTLKNGMFIEATKDHKFYIGNGQYETLENLSVNSYVYICVSDKKSNRLNDIENLNTSGIV